MKHKMAAMPESRLVILYIAAYSRDMRMAQCALNVYMHLIQQKRELTPGEEGGVICTRDSVAEELGLTSKEAYHAFKALRDLRLVVKHYVGTQPVYYRVVSPNNALELASEIFQKEIDGWMV